MLETLTAPRRPGLPGYDAYQHAFHEAFRPELYAALDELSLPLDGSVLDVPCGDGFYAAHLAARAGRLVAADASSAYLSLAREALSDHPPAEVHRADAYALPFEDGTFDLVFSAQSLISLDDPAKAIREMVRVTKPRGHVAILESDQYHHILLTLPPDLELTVQRALRAHARHKGDEERIAPARQVRRLMQEAGLRGVRRRTFAADRAAPFGGWEADFLRLHRDFLIEITRRHLSPVEAERLAAVDLAAPGAELTCLNAIHLGRRPRGMRVAE
jgi:ubiquinone/menaquinone biosynthesis C-methylase UbiE